jgi:predicted nuclease of restriction endonuclease-like RecB superfamily
LDLSAADGLRSHLPPPAAFDSLLEQSFAESWGSGRRDGWRLERETEVLHRGQKVFLPDFALRHADGRCVLLEIVGFWTPEYLRAKTETLRTFSEQRILVAVALPLRDELPDFPHDLIVFRRSLSAEDVLAKLRSARAAFVYNE